MKKLFAFLLTVAAAAACALTVSACGNGNTSAAETPSQNTGGTVSSPSDKLSEEVSPPEQVYYTVTYAANGETYAIRNVKSGGTAYNFIIPAAETQIFEYWTLNGEKYDFNLPVTGNLTLEAKFKAITHTATFLCDSEVYATYEFHSDLSEIEFPEVPEKQYYTGEWVQQASDGGNAEFTAVYTYITYNFKVLGENGEIIKTFGYTAGTPLCDIESNVPPVPLKEHYTGSWSAYTLYGEETAIRPEYTPLEYKITFTDINGAAVGTATYTVETKLQDIGQPPVPDLEGYENGRWENYELNFTDFTVRPVYDKSPDPADTFTEGLVFSPDEETDCYRVTGYGGTEPKVKIPSVYNGKQVTAIADDAFNTKPNGNIITEIILPETLLFIGKNAFSNCTQLKSVIIPDSVITLRTMAFAGCTSLESVTIGSGLSKLQKMTFVKCANLQSVVLSSRATEIDTDAFYECPKFKGITYSAQTDRRTKSE